MPEPEVWLAALPDLLAALEVEPRGVIHVGAGDGREVPHYRRLGFGRIVLVEPLPFRAADLRQLPDVEVVEAAIASLPGPRTLYVTQHDEASSVLRPLKWPPVATLDVTARRLADLSLEGLNVLVIDAQGSEVDVLRSGPLAGFELVVVEATEDVRYEEGATRETVEAFMATAGWVPVAAFPHGVEPWVVDHAFVPFRSAPSWAQ